MSWFKIKKPCPPHFEPCQLLMSAIVRVPCHWVRLSGKDSAAYHGDTEDKEHSFQPHGWWRRRNTDGTEIFNLFSVSTAPPNALTLMEHLLHLSLPGSGHPKHGGRRHSFTVPVLDTDSFTSCGSALGTAWWGELWERQPWEPQGIEGLQVPQQGASAAPGEPMLGQISTLQLCRSPCWSRICPEGSAAYGQDPLLEQVCPKGLHLTESPHWTLGKVCRGRLERNFYGPAATPPIPLHCSDKLGMKEWCWAWEKGRQQR